MIATSAKFKNHPCFKDHWSGLDLLPPVTLIIGKNNTGKSHLLHFVRDLCEKSIKNINWDLKIESHLDDTTLKLIFDSNTSGGRLGGNHWTQHGVHLINQSVVWSKEAQNGESTQILDNETWNSVSNEVAEERISRIQRAMPTATHLLHGKIFKHLLADRDIRAEAESNNVFLSSDGTGATNIVRRYINSSYALFKRDLIQVEMLNALNEVFGSDGNFQEITVKHHDGHEPDKPANIWEIFLKQEHKGLVSLSNSGSGLKTIFLVLLNLLVVPDIEGKSLHEYVFAFEELENNLHPSLLRNLLRYIQKKTSDNPMTSSANTPQFFLTTHSSVALDYFAGNENAQVIHVSHDGKSGRTQTIQLQSQKLMGILWDLGTRPSDLLQANGIIWVEGPSDRIYINKWIELFTDGELQEGKHYQCAFYGGGLLANLQVTSDEDADNNLINLLKINPNAIVISDSDKKSKLAQLKDRVRRIRDEFAKLNPERSFHWILTVREIENYLTGELLMRIMNHSKSQLPDPEQFESFFRKDKERSYLETNLNRKTFDKAELAALATFHMKIDDINDRFDLRNSIKKIISTIQIWNR